ncbi:hypothetical protein FKM82_028512, partial [Ascaphus truei]
KEENEVITSYINGSLTSFCQTGLDPGEEYLVYVTPRKGQALAPETSITVTTRYEITQGLRVTDVTTTTFVLRWERPLSPPDRYSVTLVAPNRKDRKLKVPGKGDRVKVTGLEKGTKYTVTLTAERGENVSVSVETTAST